MLTPSIIISEPQPGSFQVSVSGRFGGGFSGVRKNRDGIIEMLALLKSYDCVSEPAVVIAPDSLTDIFRKVFPKSF